MTKSVVLFIGIVYLLVVLPIPAMAAEQQLGAVRVTAGTGLVLPPQKEGKIAVPNAISKPWYKKWWVWTIVGAVVVGAAGGGGGGGAKSSSDGNTTITIAGPLPP